MVCSSCGKPKVNIGGIGSEAEYFCENPNCPSHFSHIVCPKCVAADKEITSLGIGDQVFTCKKCGNTYTQDDI